MNKIKYEEYKNDMDKYLVEFNNFTRKYFSDNNFGNEYHFICRSSLALNLIHELFENYRQYDGILVAKEFLLQMVQQILETNNTDGAYETDKH
jgi:hypothetical protein